MSGTSFPRVSSWHPEVPSPQKLQQPGPYGRARGLSATGTRWQRTRCSGSPGMMTRGDLPGGSSPSSGHPPHACGDRVTPQCRAGGACPRQQALTGSLWQGAKGVSRAGRRKGGREEGTPHSYPKISSFRQDTQKAGASCCRGCVAQPHPPRPQCRL